jgi:hypothetical protein
MEINTSENVFFQYTKREFASLQPIHYTYMLTMSLPFFFYSFAWIYPKHFVRAVANPLGQHPSNTVATICYVAKALQIFFTLLCVDFSSFPLTAIVFFTICAGFGQLLNSRVYALLGHYGIFYGCRFGIEIEWVNAFPYSHISDPQYWGAWLTILGCGYWIPKVPLIWWLLNYNFMMVVESKECTPRYPLPLPKKE